MVGKTKRVEETGTGERSSEREGEETLSSDLRERLSKQKCNTGSTEHWLIQTQHQPARRDGTKKGWPMELNTETRESERERGGRELSLAD